MKNTTIDFNNIWTRNDILKYLRISLKTYHRWTKKGILKNKGVKKGNIRLYDKNEIKKLINQLKKY